MSGRLLNTLNELFEGPTPPSNESLMGLLDETMGFFRDIKAKFDSKDPQKREEAIQEAQEMKKSLESQINLISEKAGFDPSQLASLMQDPGAVAPEDRNLIEEVKERLEQVEKSGKHVKPYKPLIR